MNLFLRTLLGNLVLRTLLGNLFPGILPGTPLLANLVLETFFATFSWKPLPKNLAWTLFLGTLLSWVPCLATVPGTLAWESCLGTCSWEPCLGKVSGNLACEPVPGTLLGNLASERPWESCLWTCSWEPVLGMAEDPKLTLLGKKRTAYAISHIFRRGKSHGFPVSNKRTLAGSKPWSLSCTWRRSKLTIEMVILMAMICKYLWPLWC